MLGVVAPHNKVGARVNQSTNFTLYPLLRIADNNSDPKFSMIDPIFLKQTPWIRIIRIATINDDPFIFIKPHNICIKAPSYAKWPLVCPRLPDKQSRRAVGSGGIRWTNDDEDAFAPSGGELAMRAASEEGADHGEAVPQETQHEWCEKMGRRSVPHPAMAGV